MPADVLEKPATVEDVAREVSKIRSIVTDAVKDGVRSGDKSPARTTSHRRNRLQSLWRASRLSQIKLP